MSGARPARSDMIGAVLVGGRSRRMGTDKALIEISGEFLVDRSARLLRDAGCWMIAAIGPPRLGGSVPVTADDFPDDGPLGGILTALRLADAAGARSAMVVACDLPALDTATLSSLADAATRDDVEIVVATAGGVREPLVAWWSVSAADALHSVFSAGERSVRRAIDRVVDSIGNVAALRLTEVPVDPSAVVNMNTPDRRPQ